MHLIVKNVLTYKTRKLATNYLSTILGDFISSSHLNAELYKSSSKGLQCIEKYNFLKKTFFKLLSTLRLKKDWKSLSSKMKHITQNLIPTGWFCKFNYEILHISMGKVIKSCLLTAACAVTCVQPTILAPSSGLSVQFRFLRSIRPGISVWEISIRQVNIQLIYLWSL